MTQAGQPLIEIENLTKIFYADEVETHALSGIHLTIRQGEYVAMSGPSGCGKSTLLSINWSARHSNRRQLSLE